MDHPSFPEVLRPLLSHGFVSHYEGAESKWGLGRPWKLVCSRCGKEFHPLPTAAAVANIMVHVEKEKRR